MREYNLRRKKWENLFMRFKLQKSEAVGSNKKEEARFAPKRNLIKLKWKIEKNV